MNPTVCTDERLKDVFLLNYLFKYSLQKCINRQIENNNRTKLVTTWGFIQILEQNFLQLLLCNFFSLGLMLWRQKQNDNKWMQKKKIISGPFSHGFQSCMLRVLDPRFSLVTLLSFKYIFSIWGHIYKSKEVIHSVCVLRS